VVKVVAGPSIGKLPRAEFERNLGRKIDVVLPADHKAFDQATNAGKPVAACAPKSLYAREVSALTTALGYVPASRPSAARRLGFGPRGQTFG
jgi:Flp pilus assembly CpaE family ATPase